MKTFNNKLIIALSVMLFAYTFTLSAQVPNYLNYPVNRNGELRYSFTVHSSDLVKAQKLGHAIAIEALNTNMKLDYEPNIDTSLVDVIFYLSDNKICTGKYERSFKSTKKAVSEALDIINTKFYSGTPPQHSTVFEANDGYYLEYRIPSALVLPSGRILAFIEARSSNQDQAENDMVVKYSDDRGKSWSKLIVIDQQGEASLNNPCTLYIPETNQVMMVYQCFPPNITEGNATSQTDATVRTYIVFSDDEGESWSKPRDITEQVKRKEAASYCSGPGVALRIASGEHKGRIVIPFNINGGNMWCNYLVYSDDHGKEWKMSNTQSGYGTNESQIVQINDTTLLLNARSHRFAGDTSKVAPKGWNPWNFNMVTRNRGEIKITMKGDKFEWGETIIRSDEPDPTCQGSIMRISGLDDGDISRILLLNAANQKSGNSLNRVYASTPPSRINGEIKISYDDSKSWSYKKRVYGNRFTEFQYSVIIDLGDGWIGCFFEAHPQINYTIFNLEWLTEGEDK